MGMFRSGKRYHMSMVMPAPVDEVADYIQDSLKHYGDGRLFTESQYDANAPRNWTAGRHAEVAVDGHLSEPEFKVQITLDKTQMDERCRLTVNAETRTRKLASFERDVLSGSWAKAILHKCLGIDVHSSGRGMA
ncbi:MAG: hypothetical protein ACP5OR_05655 [Candidatus Dormibacteria bacterium]